MLERHGVEYASQSEEIKEKIKQTNLERHGVEYASQSEEIKEKTKKTNLERYGVENVFQSPEIKEKAKMSNLERHGVEYASQSEEIKEKTKKTNLERHGAEYTFQSTAVREKSKLTNIRRHGSTSWINSHIPAPTKQLLNNQTWLSLQNKEKSLIEIAHELNVNPLILSIRFKQFNIPVKRHAKSFFEKQVFTYVESIHSTIIQNDRTQIKPYELDVYIPELKLAFECNGEYWHKDPQKEIDKFNMCKNIGIDLHFIWYKDWQKDQNTMKKYIASILTKKS